MVHRRLAALASVLLSACGPAVGDEEATGCDPWAEVCTITMRPDFGQSVRLRLPTAQTEETESLDEMRGDEVAAGMSRYLTLGSFGGEGVQCLLPNVHDDLSEIEPDESGCECDALAGCWGGIVYFGLVGDPPDAFVGRGILLRTPTGELYRARVLHDDARQDSVELTIEYEGVR